MKVTIITTIAIVPSQLESLELMMVMVVLRLGVSWRSIRALCRILGFFFAIARRQRS